jgi:hypothetical protein
MVLLYQHLRFTIRVSIIYIIYITYIDLKVYIFIICNICNSIFDLPMYLVAPTPIATTRNEDSINSTKYTTYASQTNPALVLKKKDSTVQCSQTTTIKSTLLSYYFTAC